jgi:hypothetical protein
MSTLATNAITDASGGNTATINSYTPTESNMAGRNRIINGDMRIDQRNAGASVSMTASSPYILDRWRFWANGDGGSATYTVQQSSTAPAGFTNSCVITQTASYSPTGANYNIFAQYIEGNNVADLGWGTANAKTVTLSFWVRSSLTGTFGGVVSNASQARSYPFTYTISSADTWEYKTITVPGDTSGTWLTTNGIGLEVYWQLGVGPSYLGTAGAWAGAAYLGATGATQITATNGATLYITGVQLEAGSVATPFEHRQYGQELALCQRYYEKFGDGCPLSLQTSTSYQLSARFLVEKRATPTFLHVTNYGVVCAGNGQTITSLLSTNTATTKGCVLNVVPNNFIGVTAGQAAYVSSSIDGLSASSEL